MVMHSPCYYDITDHETLARIAARVDCSCNEFSHTSYVSDHGLGGCDFDTHAKFLDHFISVKGLTPLT